LLTLLWLLTIAALCIAFISVLQARRAARRVERLTESYWEIRYEVAQLRARVARLEPPLPGDEAEPAAAPDKAATFVPLSALKRS
jgi:hypothetical protein